MTEAIYLEVAEKAETAHKAGRRVSVSGMLKYLGVSRSGYRAWLKHVPSNAEQRRETVKAKIKDIYDESKQNYGAPKITKELRKSGEIISERTVGKYMRQMGIKAQWVKPWTITTKDSDFSSELQNILDERLCTGHMGTTEPVPGRQEDIPSGHLCRQIIHRTLCGWRSHSHDQPGVPRCSLREREALQPGRQGRIPEHEDSHTWFIRLDR